MYTKKNLVLYTASGAYICQSGSISDITAGASLADVVWLVDMDWPGVTPEEFTGWSQVFVIGATSPQRSSTSRWAKYSTIHTLVLNPPEFSEYVSLTTSAFS